MLALIVYAAADPQKTRPENTKTNFGQKISKFRKKYQEVLLKS